MPFEAPQWHRHLFCLPNKLLSRQSDPSTIDFKKTEHKSGSKIRCQRDKSQTAVMTMPTTLEKTFEKAVRHTQVDATDAGAAPSS